MLSTVIVFHLGCSQPCTVTLEQSPELRGLRLGMSLSDIQKRFSGFPFVSANQFGVATVEISSAYASNVLDKPIRDDIVSLLSASSFPDLKGVKHVELKLLDGRLIEISFFYPNDLTWKSADEFVKKTAEALKLDGSWTKIGDDRYSAVRLLQCGGEKAPDEMFMVKAGFQDPPLEDLSIDTFRLPFVTLEDFLNGEMEVFRRQQRNEEKTKREEEERKQIFKP
jgi:hypothetical protein